MSTPALVVFMSDGVEIAHVYVSGDGYETRMLADWKQFCEAVRVQCKPDTRFTDAGYLAAKYVFWRAIKDPEWSADRPLKFLGVGIDAPCGDLVDYTYEVACDQDALVDHKPVLFCTKRPASA